MSHGAAVQLIFWKPRFRACMLSSCKRTISDLFQRFVSAERSPDVMHPQPGCKDHKTAVLACCAEAIGSLTLGLQIATASSLTCSISLCLSIFSSVTCTHCDVPQCIHPYTLYLAPFAFSLMLVVGWHETCDKVHLAARGAATGMDKAKNCQTEQYRTCQAPPLSTAGSAETSEGHETSTLSPV